MSNPHTPTVAEEVEALMELSTKAAANLVLTNDPKGKDPVAFADGYLEASESLCTHLTTLLTRLRAAEEVCDAADQVLQYLDTVGSMTNKATILVPLEKALSTHTRLRQEQDNG